MESEKVKEKSDNRLRLFYFLTLSLFHCLLCTATLFAQHDVVFIDGYPDSSAGDFNPYPGIGTAPSATHTEIPTTMLYADNGHAATFGLPPSPTKKTSDIFFASGQTPRREGAFQKVNFDVLWAPKGKGERALGLTQLNLSATFGLPAPTREAPLLVKPFLQTSFFDSPTFSPTLHTAGVDFLWFVPLVKNQYMLALGATPSYSGDFKAKKESFRIPAHLVGIWSCNPRTKVLLGVLYLDRKTSYNWLPMGGIVWTPNEDINFELTFPRVRLSQRLKWWGSAAGDSVSDWLYGGFEFGTGSWGWQAGPDFDTRLEYSDYRLQLGYERRGLSGLTLALEAGWMFKREVAIPGRPSYRQDDAFFLQLKTSY